MQIIVMSMEDVERGEIAGMQTRQPNSLFAVISIRDLGARHIFVITQRAKQTFGVLRLDYDDNEFGPKAITPAQAKETADFIRQAASAGVDVLCCHCKAGVSRSAATAAAAAEILGQNNDEFFRDPYFLNILVYTSILKAAGKTPKRGAYDRVVNLEDDEQ
jgi:predicted protein tyrosine phosphatase